MLRPSSGAQASCLRVERRTPRPFERFFSSVHLDTDCGRVDTCRSVLHAARVLTLSRQLFALALAVLISAGNGVVCAGWAPTPQARMACCAESACPMHKGDSQHSGSGRVITQAEADSCCASAEHETSSQSSPTFVAPISSAVLGTGIALPAPVPALVLSDGWRTLAPIPTAHVPKHVLLSVFLV
jgi:hypothetical protein